MCVWDDPLTELVISRMVINNRFYQLEQKMGKIPSICNIHRRVFVLLHKQYYVTSCMRLLYCIRNYEQTRDGLKYTQQP